MDLGRYGFRRDPMEWATSTDSLDAAWVRTEVLERPKLGDAAIITEEIARIFSQQKPDGHIGDETHAALMRLLDLRCSPAKPEFRTALKAMHDRKVAEDGHLGGYELHIAGRAAWWDADQLKQATRKLIEEVGKLNFWHACPWTGEVDLQMLWACRSYGNVVPAVERGLTIMRDHLKNGRCWPIYLDPFGWLECMGYIDHPLAKEIVVRMIPMILRAQAPDGSWGGDGHLGYGPGSHTFVVFRALHRWGLMEPLRDMPPLPPEWTVCKTIPSPDGDLGTMTWDGSRLWVYDKTSGEAVAISAEDGEKLHAIKLPENIGGIAWSNGSLLATRAQPEAVLFIDPDTGAVTREIAAQVWGEFSAIAELDDRICIGNAYCGGVHFLTGGEIGKHPRWLAGGFAVDMACADGYVWHIDAFNRLLIQSDPNRTECLIDWAGAPFGEETAGLAWDGRNLWALDSRDHRISIIEKANRPAQATADSHA